MTEARTNQRNRASSFPPCSRSRPFSSLLPRLYLTTQGDPQIDIPIRVCEKNDTPHEDILGVEQGNVDTLLTVQTFNHCQDSKRAKKTFIDLRTSQRPSPNGHTATTEVFKPPNTHIVTSRKIQTSTWTQTLTGPRNGSGRSGNLTGEAISTSTKHSSGRTPRHSD